MWETKCDTTPGATTKQNAIGNNQREIIKYLKREKQNRRDTKKKQQKNKKQIRTM